MARNAELEERITKFAARSVRVCEALPPRRIGTSNIADQLLRASMSVAANYAEATQAESRKDFVHKLKIALKELTESRTWLKVIVAAEYLDVSRLSDLIDETDQLMRILSSSVITARKGL